MKKLFLAGICFVVCLIAMADGILSNIGGNTTVGGTPSATTMNVGTLVVTNQIFGDVMLTNTHSKYFHLYEEFTSGSQPTDAGQSFGGSVFYGIATTDNQHLGQVVINSSSNVTNGVGDYVGSMMLGGGPTTYETVVQITPLGTGGTLFTEDIGCGSALYGANFPNGVWFRYASDMNSGNWIAMSSNGGTVSSNNTSVAVTTGWTRLTWTWAPSSPITYYVNGTPVFTNTSANIPTNNTYGLIWRTTERSGSGTTRQTFIDYVDYTCLYTTPR